MSCEVEVFLESIMRNYRRRMGTVSEELSTVGSYTRSKNISVSSGDVYSYQNKER